MERSQELTAPAPGRRWVRIVGAAVLALVVATAAWFITSLIRGDDTKTPEVLVQPVGPIALTAQGLKTLGAEAGQPIYWAGPRKGHIYELKRDAKGQVFVRYLPPGVRAGAPDGPYLVIATYPYKNAYDALARVDGEKYRLANGGLALVDAKSPTSVHVAYPGRDFQAEVYDPSPERALEVARSGAVRAAR